MNNPMQVRDELPKFERRSIDQAGWRLLVEGLVEQSLSLTYDDITRLPKISLTDDFSCLEGWVVRGIVWEGIKVSSVLKFAKLKPEAANAMFSSGGFSTVVPISKALDDSTILALSMRGKALDQYHGGPVRLVFNGQECYDSVKSVDSVKVLANHLEGTAKGIALSRLANRT